MNLSVDRTSLSNLLIARAGIEYNVSADADLETVLASKPAWGPGDLININPGVTVTVTSDTVMPESVGFRLQPGAVLTSAPGGQRLLIFSGFPPDTTPADNPVVMYGGGYIDDATVTERTVLSNIYILDRSDISCLRATVYATSLNLYKPELIPSTFCVITGCTLQNNHNEFSIDANQATSMMITNNTFIGYNTRVSSMYLSGDDDTLLVMTGNTFRKCNMITLDYAYLRNSLGDINGNVFEDSCTPPAFKFIQPLTGSVCVPTLDEFTRIILSNYHTKAGSDPKANPIHVSGESGYANPVVPEPIVHPFLHTYTSN